MKAEWLEHLLEGRGISGGVRSARLVSAMDGDLFLEVETNKHRNGRPFVTLASSGDTYVATERHVVALGGMVFE